MASIVESSDQETKKSKSSTLVNILCCMCGTSIKSNGINMCGQCIRTQVDITEGISKTGNVHQCKRCLHFQTASGRAWMPYMLESRELLALCLKRIHGLGTAKLMDAAFVWTEPHSKRLKVKVTIQKEVVNSVMMQSSFVVELVIKMQQCPECTKEFTNQTWKTVVQVRQHASHKRTFLLLEQLILQKGLHHQCLDLQVSKDGMDFYFADKQSAKKISDFIVTTIPGKIRTSRKMISEDRKNNVHKCQHSISVDIVPACKDDLLLVKAKEATRLGLPCAGLYLVSRVTSQLHLLDPLTLARFEVTADKYFRGGPTVLFTAKGLSEFIVLDIEEETEIEDKERLVQVEVARSCDFGLNDQTLLLSIHFSNRFLGIGDTVLGYDLLSANIDEREFSSIKRVLPDAILVRKQNAKKKKKRKLRRGFFSGSRGERGRNARETSTIADEDMDYQLFLQELEDDADLRQKLGLDEAQAEEHQDHMKPIAEETMGDEPVDEKDTLKSNTFDIPNFVSEENPSSTNISNNEDSGCQSAVEKDHHNDSGATHANNNESECLLHEELNILAIT